VHSVLFGSRARRPGVTRGSYPGHDTRVRRAGRWRFASAADDDQSESKQKGFGAAKHRERNRAAPLPRSSNFRQSGSPREPCLRAAGADTACDAVALCLGTLRGAHRRRCLGA
jgi:hypothetical protein